LDDSVRGPNSGAAWHGAFWRGKTRDEFVEAKFMGQQLITLRNAAESGLIKALKEEAPFGTDIDTAGALYTRIPAGKAPFQMKTLK
jgi:hypothetical protein